MSERAIPSDCTILPLLKGGLLLSRAHATWCRLFPEELEAAQRALSPGEGGLPAPLLERLEGHGFFGPPRAAPPESPSVQMQLTNVCNLACTYCCTNSGQPRGREMGRERWLALADEIRAAMGPGTRAAVLGGEPLSLPWAIELAERIVELGLTLTLFTNGVPLTSEPLARRVGALAARGAQVRVSLAGPTRETCDALSGAKRFEEVVAGVNEVARHGPAPIVDLMLAPQLVSSIAGELPGLRGRLPPGTAIALGVLFHGGRETGAHLFGSRSELEAALDRIAFEAGERIRGTGTDAVTARREACTCALGHHLHVRSDGVLFTCFKMEEQVGDLSRETFGEALSRVRANPRPASTLLTCAACPLATLCGGGCRAENIQFTGDPDVPVCGPWRVKVLSELLADDRPSALEWPALHLWSEARARGIEVPARLTPAAPSRHLIDT